MKFNIIFRPQVSEIFFQGELGAFVRPESMLSPIELKELMLDLADDRPSIKAVFSHSLPSMFPNMLWVCIERTSREAELVWTHLVAR